MAKAEQERVEVFPEWRNKPLDHVLGLCRDLVEDSTYPTVRRWRDAGGKVLGHFQVYFPEELAHALGLLPVKLRGAPIEATEAESRFGSYLCSIIKTSLELALSGKLELDMFVSHPICDAARNLAAIWGRNCSYRCQILYLPQNANSEYAPGYLREELARMLGDLEQVAGRSASEADLRSSLRVFNQNRALLRDLYELKRRSPWKVEADDAYALVALAGILPREEHNELLRRVLPELHDRSSRQQDRIRIVFEGGFCEQPPIELIRMIGRTCYLVDDDLLIGLRWLVSDVDETGDPLASLADAYLEASSYSPVQRDIRKPKDRMLLQRVSRSGAEAVILAAAKMCEPGLEEQVSYTQALESEDIPFFVTEFQETMTSFDQLELQLETFVENLLFD